LAEVSTYLCEEAANLAFFSTYLFFQPTDSEESKTEVSTQRLGYSPLFRKKYPRTSLQIGQFLRGSTFSLAFLNDASILDLFSSSVNKFISKFQKLLSPSTPG
jgi:hypothetical protein